MCSCKAQEAVEIDERAAAYEHKQKPHPGIAGVSQESGRGLHAQSFQDPDNDRAEHHKEHDADQKNAHPPGQRKSTRYLEEGIKVKEPVKC